MTFKVKWTYERRCDICGRDMLGEEHVSGTSSITLYGGRRLGFGNGGYQDVCAVCTKELVHFLHELEEGRPDRRCDRWDSRRSWTR